VTLIVAFVLGGLSIDGALAGVVAASAIELVVARRFVRPGFSHASHVEARAMWGYVLPLFVAAASLRLFDKLDLFVLKALGGSATLAGVYGAAQNLTIIPNLVALSVTTLLLSTLSRALRAGDTDGARQLATNAIRGVLVLLPFAGVAAGAATALASLIYGSAFAETGPLLGVLIFAAIAVVMISVASSILTAIGKPTWAMWATLPIAPLALAGHLIVIPRFGAPGATYVTLGVATFGAICALVAVSRAWKITPPATTVLRVTLVTVTATVVGAWWRTTGVMVVVELVAMSLIAIGLLAALGERPTHDLTSSTRRLF
jgi:O-antigen/teichoic acid export membrane protein